MRLRIVQDAYAGYEVQARYKYIPFWFQCWRSWDNSTNSHSTIEKAEEFAKQVQKGGFHRVNRVVKELNIKQESPYAMEISLTEKEFHDLYDKLSEGYSKSMLLEVLSTAIQNVITKGKMDNSIKKNK